MDKLISQKKKKRKKKKGNYFESTWCLVAGADHGR
jgi:hypothetical protein